MVVQEGGQAGRTKLWDACLYGGFARTAGGGTPRPYRAERLRNRIGKDRFPSRHAGRALQLTVSVGLAIGPGEDARPEDLIREADLALLSAKTAGRNTVTCAASAAA